MFITNSQLLHFAFEKRIYAVDWHAGLTLYQDMTTEFSTVSVHRTKLKISFLALGQQSLRYLKEKVKKTKL